MLPANRCQKDLRDPLLANQTTTTPFPERTDPFEFGKGVVFDVPAGSDNEVENIRLYGFACADQPKAIINIDEKRKCSARVRSGEWWKCWKYPLPPFASRPTASRGYGRCWDITSKTACNQPLTSHDPGVFRGQCGYHTSQFVNSYALVDQRKWI